MDLSKLKNLRTIKPPALFLLTLLFLTSILRLVNLGYSDYIGDEHKAFLSTNEGQSAWNFLIQQRKGPMQFLVTYIPRLIIGDFSNELAQRLPFALISILCVWVFYKLVKKLTQNEIVSLSSTFLFMVNGFIVGFGRIAQYQNLNILFSFLALYMYSDLLFKEKKLIASTLLGTLFWCLSIMSHWDAVFIIPVVAWFFVSFLKNKKFTIHYKIRILIYNFFLGCLVLLPFMIPYVIFHIKNTPSGNYFERRIGMGYTNNKLYKMYVDLYNPFVTFWLTLALSIIGVVKNSKSKLFIVWFLFSYTLFELFVRKPGTHIYNFIIPVFILCGFGFEYLFKKIKKEKTRLVFLVSTVFISAFLYFQSYLIFVDHKKEYPWEPEEYIVFNQGCEILKNFCQKYDIVKMVIKTKEYHYDYEGEKLPLFGFPHSRNWDYINQIINSYNSNSKKELGYSTNEDQSVSSFYMDVNYKSSGAFYFIGIVKPTDFVVDTSPPHKSEKELLEVLKRNGDEIYAKIYLVNFKKGD